jgi:outer membrane protein OmpA-like peptidoglycan-associated protein
MSREADGVTECIYPPGQVGRSAQARVRIEWDAPRRQGFGAQLAEAVAGTEPGHEVARKVEGLGEESTWTRDGELTVRTGSTLISIDVPMGAESRDRGAAIGKRLLLALGVAPAAPRAKAPDAAHAGTQVPPDGDRPPQAAPGDPLPRLPHLPEGIEVVDECPDAGADVQREMEEQATARIPLKVGLTLARIWNRGSDDPDRECLTQVIGIDARGVDVSVTCPVGSDRRIERTERRVCRVDLRSGVFTQTASGASIPRVLLGATMWSVSQDLFRKLSGDRSPVFDYIQVQLRKEDGAPFVQRRRPVRLVRTSTTPVPYPVVVNDRQVSLPSLTAQPGNPAAMQVQLHVLDDESLPVILSFYYEDGFAIRVMRVSFPDEDSIEKQLASDRRIDVYGIYFDFASDELRPESEPVLQEIAAVLAARRDWQLTIGGHTDNVGGDASNLDLSRRRAEAVRRALVERHGVDADRLSTQGLGASQPKDSNDTVEGRARNRRVELIRR